MTVKLCIVSEYFYPVLAGAAERFRRYIPGLKARGINVEVFTVAYGDNLSSECFDGIPIRRLQLASFKMEPSALLLKQSLQYFVATNSWPDVLHINSHTLRGVPYAWAARFHNTACVNAITMIPPKRESVGGNTKQLIRQWLRYSPFNQVVVSSNVVAQRVLKQGVRKKRIKVIPNGVDISRFRPPRSMAEKKAIRRKLGLNEDKVIISFVGFFSYRKGVDLLLDAWPQVAALFPQAQLMFVGPATPEPVSRAGSPECQVNEGLNEKLKTTQKSGQFLFTGEVDNVEEYIRASDILILPSRREGMGNVIAEGMATGLPCVVTPFDGLPHEFGQPGKEYVLTSFSPTQITIDLIELLSSQSHRETIGSAARYWVERHLDVEKTLDDYAEMYQRLAKIYRK